MNNGQGFGGGGGRAKGRGAGRSRGLGAGQGCGRGKGFARGAQLGPTAAILPVSPANAQENPPPRVARAGSRLVAVVNADKCTGCGICTGFCPSQAISVGAVATIDTKRCTGCGESVAVCAARALSVTLRALAKRNSTRDAIG